MARLIMLILWPSFLVAIVAEGVFFSLLDPRDLLLAGQHVEVTPIGVYSLGFFCFWLFGSLASSLTCYLSCDPNQRQMALRHQDA